MALRNGAMLITRLLFLLFLCGPRGLLAAPSSSIDDALSYDDASPNPSSLRQLVPRDQYSCDENTPCSNHACCGKSGYCGYGPTYCGTTGQSPNDACWSNCDAHAECGQYALKPGTTCPLNVCCSQFGFCGTTEDFCGSGCQSYCSQPGSGASGGNVQKRIVGYYESWSIGRQCMGMELRQIPVESLTHLNYAFGYISPGDFQIGPMPGTDPKTFQDFTDLKQRNGAIVMGISIGGWSFNDNGTDTQPVFGDVVSSAGNRATFIRNLLTFMNHYGFDLVDLDWEYPGAPDRQPNQANSEEDGANYVLLLQEMRRAFDGEDRKLYISFTAPTSYWYLRWFDINKMSKAADYVNFMTYDLHGTWDASDPIGNQILAHTNLTEIGLALDLLWRNGVEPGKVNMGMAFYSRTFTLQNPSCNTPGCPFSGGGSAGGCTATSGILSYREITDVLASHNNIVPYYDKAAAVKYFTWNTKQWASYDDEQTFQQKIAYANDQGLGGLLIWAIDQDDSNLDALRGILYPAQLKDGDIGDDVSFWESQQPGDCETTSCGGSCSPGTIQITTLKCPSGGKNNDQKLCCPIASAPDPSTCHWRGGEKGLIKYCNGQCHGGEVALASSKDGGNGHCVDGRQFYCCPIPEVADGAGINCGWQDKCRSDQTLMTFAGTFLEDLDPILRAIGGLTGDALADALDQYDLKDGKRYCCGKEEYDNWKDCYWAGTPGKGFDSCDDNHCATGHEVELTTSYFGEAETCAPKLERQRAWCCSPASGKSLFLPVPLEDLFPNPPPSNIADPIFNLEVDDTWGTGLVEGEDDPDHASFGFVVITAPDEVQVSLRKRDGSPWELFDCFDAESEEQQTIRMICTDNSEESRCNDIHKGFGAAGTIIDMPEGCGPGKYAVVKDMVVSQNQTLPGHIIRKRSWSSEVYDLTFDYDFKRVPRAFGDSQMRIDFSNQEGYWDSVVDRPGQKMKKRDMENFRRNRKRWLEDEWSDARHFGGLSKEELHKRWFGESVITWLANLIGVGQASVTEELNHKVDETLQVILIDQQFGPCDIGGGVVAQANVKSTLDAHVQVDTSFGLTIIVTLTSPGPLDLSKSYLYFKNKGSVTASFSLEAVATLSYQSGDIKMIGLDDFPGATFRVPGIVTVGPNIAVYGAVDAFLTLEGHFQAETTIAKWETQQTFPETDQYPAAALDEPDQDGSQTIGKPSIDAGVSAQGEVALHLKPTVTFGIDFDDRWGVTDCSASLVLDGYVIFHAEASYQLGGDNSCPFSYGIDAGANMFARLVSPSFFGWGGVNVVPLGNLARRQITPETCPSNGASSRLVRSLDGTLDFRGNGSSGSTVEAYRPPHDLFNASTSQAPPPSLPFAVTSHTKRDTFRLGPLITIPDSFLKCPSTTNDTGDCPICADTGSASQKRLRARDDEPAEVETMVCNWYPAPGDGACDASNAVSGNNKERAVTSDKPITLPYDPPGRFTFSTYPPCGQGSTAGILKWFMPISERADMRSCDPTIVQLAKQNGRVGGVDSGQFNTDHVFEVQLVSSFLAWLCGSNQQYSYGSGGTQIKFPTNDGWQQPNTNWCRDVFGGYPNTGFYFPAYPGDSNGENWVRNTARFLGNADQTGLLAILHKEPNGVKANWCAGNDVTVDGNVPAVRSSVQTSASVFSYLQDSNVQQAWTESSNNIEKICDQFDQSFWGSAAEQQAATTAGNVPLRRGPQPNDVTHWGLRTMWAYWIDNHLAKADVKVGPWLDKARSLLEAETSGSSNAARNFLQQFMAPGRIASTDQMHFPRRANWRTTPLPGAGDSGTSTQSRYMMWNNPNNFGPVGLTNTDNQTPLP